MKNTPNNPNEAQDPSPSHTQLVCAVVNQEDGDLSKFPTTLQRLNTLHAILIWALEDCPSKLDKEEKEYFLGKLKAIVSDAGALNDTEEGIFQSINNLINN